MLHLQPSVGTGSVAGLGRETARGRTVMGHAGDGGQASDQASERAPGRHRPHSLGQIPVRTPARGQSGLESRASTVGASLALAPDGAARTLTVRPCKGLGLLPFMWAG